MHVEANIESFTRKMLSKKKKQWKNEIINKSKRQQQQQQHPKEDKEIKLSDIDFNFEKLINSSQKKNQKKKKTWSIFVWRLIQQKWFIKHWQKWLWTRTSKKEIEKNKKLPPFS